MPRKPETYFIPDEPEAAARFWRARATELERQAAELKAALARKTAIEEGRPVPPVVRARPPKRRW
jgi:hypothetical protein